MFIFTGCSQTETVNVTANDVLQRKSVVYKYSPQEVRDRLSNPSSHYKSSGKFPDIKAGTWEIGKNDSGNEIHYSYIDSLGTTLAMEVNKENELTIIGFIAYDWDKPTEQKLEKVNAVAEMVASSIGLRGGEINRHIHKLVRAKGDYSGLDYRDFILETVSDRKDKTFSFSILINRDK